MVDDVGKKDIKSSQKTIVSNLSWVVVSFYLFSFQLFDPQNGEIRHDNPNKQVWAYNLNFFCPYI